MNGNSRSDHYILWGIRLGNNSNWSRLFSNVGVTAAVTLMIVVVTFSVTVVSWSSLPSPSWSWCWSGSFPSLVLNNNWVSLDVLLMDFVDRFVDWDDLVLILDVWVNLVFGLMVGVDDWLKDVGNVQVVLVEVVLQENNE